ESLSAKHALGNMSAVDLHGIGAALSRAAAPKGGSPSPGPERGREAAGPAGAARPARWGRVKGAGRPTKAAAATSTRLPITEKGPESPRSSAGGCMALPPCVQCCYTVYCLHGLATRAAWRPPRRVPPHLVPQAAAHGAGRAGA